MSLFRQPSDFWRRHPHLNTARNAGFVAPALLKDPSALSPTARPIARGGGRRARGEFTATPADTAKIFTLTAFAYRRSRLGPQAERHVCLDLRARSWLGVGLRST